MTQTRVEDQTASDGSPDTTYGPPVWFSLPPGFVPLGDRLPEDLAETLTSGLSPAAADALTQALDGAARMLEAQRRSPLRFHAAGMHPREDGGTDLSQLSAGSSPVERGTPEALLLGVAESEQAREETVSVAVHDFPAGPAVVAERSLTEGAVEVRGIRATFAHPDLQHLAVLDLTSNAVEAWAAYRSVMLGILAPTLTFEDPARQARETQVRRDLGDRLASRLGSATAEEERTRG